MGGYWPNEAQCSETKCRRQQLATIDGATCDGGEGKAFKLPYIFEGLSAGHLLLQLFLELLAGADGLLVTGEVGQLLQPGVREVFGEVLAAPLVRRKQLLQHKRTGRVKY